jgi:purine-binding chemotaxis protein CheW
LDRELNNRRRGDEDTQSSPLIATHAESVWPDLTDDPSQYVTFMLAGELFAIGAPLVRDMLAYRNMDHVDAVPPCVRGRVEFQGKSVPVIDPLALFGKPSSAITRRTGIVVCDLDIDGERHPVGVVVDAFSEVMEITTDEMQPVRGDAACGGDFILGRGKVRGRVVSLLAIDKIFSAPAARARAAVVREAARCANECGTCAGGARSCAA